MKKLTSQIKERFSTGHWPGFLTGIISSLMNLFLPTVLVRILTPEDVGIYKIFFLYIQSFTFLSLAGAPLYSVFYFIGKEDGKSFVDHAWKTSAILSTFALILGLIFSPLIAQKTALTLNQTLILLFSGAIITPSSFYGEYILAKGKTLAGPLFHSSFEILKGIAIILCAVITRDINITFYCFGISFILKLTLSVILGKREGLLNLNIQKEKIKEVVSYCAPMSLAGLLGFFLEKIDMLTLSSYLTPRDFAFYSMGCLVIPPLFILEMSVTKVLMPKLSRLWHNQGLTQMAKEFRKAQADIAYLMIPAVFGLVLFSTPIIKILFTEKYIESAVYLKVFAFSYLAYIIPHDTIARASGNTKWVLKVYLAITPLSLVSVIFVARSYGAFYALILSVLLRFVPKIWGVIYSSRKTKSKISDLLPLRSYLQNVLINFVLVIIISFLKIYISSDKMWFLVGGPLYASGFFGFQYLTKMKVNKS